MSTPFILVFGLTVATCIIAYWSDNLGKKLGKKRISLLGLRPRQTATLISMVSSVGIMLFTLAVLLISSASLRNALTRYDRERAENNRLKAENKVWQASLVVSQREAKEAQDKTTEAQNKLVAVQGQLKDVGSRLVKARQAESVARRAEAGARRAEASARRGEATARQRATQAQERFEAAQVQLASVNTGLTQTRRQLTRERQFLAQARQSLSAARLTLGATKTQLVAARSDLSNARNRLAEARDQLSEAKTTLATTRSSLASTKDALQSTKNAMTFMRTESQKQLDALQATVDARQAEVVELEDKRAELEQKALLLEKHVALLDQRLQIAERLVTGEPVAFPFGTVFVEQILPVGLTLEAARSRLTALLSQGRQKVAQRPGSPDLSLVPLPVRVGDRLVQLEEDEILEHLATFVTSFNVPVAVRVVAARDHIADEPEIVARLVTVPVRVAFPRGEAIAETTFDSGQNDAGIFNQLLKLINKGEHNARGRGVIPPLTPESPHFYASDTNERIFEALRAIQEKDGTSQVRLVAAKDLVTVEPLQVRFEINGQSSAAVARASGSTEG